MREFNERKYICEEIFEARRAHSITGLNLTKDWVDLNKAYIDWNEPQAGALCCIKLRESQYDLDRVEAFYSNARKANIQLASGEWFGEEKRFFRLGFGYMSIENLNRTLDALTGIVQHIASQ